MSLSLRRGGILQNSATLEGFRARFAFVRSKVMPQDLRSGLWPGHSKGFILFVFSHLEVGLRVCFGSDCPAVEGKFASAWGGKTDGPRIPSWGSFSEMRWDSSAILRKVPLLSGQSTECFPKSHHDVLGAKVRRAFMLFALVLELSFLQVASEVRASWDVVVGRQIKKQVWISIPLFKNRALYWHWTNEFWFSNWSNAKIALHKSNCALLMEDDRKRWLVVENWNSDNGVHFKSRKEIQKINRVSKRNLWWINSLSINRRSSNPVYYLTKLVHTGVKLVKLATCFFLKTSYIDMVSFFKTGCQLLHPTVLNVFVAF